MNLRNIVRAMFIIVPFLILAAVIWNVIVFRDCMAHGNAMYQCQAAMSNPNYIAVDRMGD